MELWHFFVDWYNERPAMLWSIAFPSLMSLCCLVHLVRNHSFPEWKFGIAFVLLATAFGFEWSFWDVQQDMVSLHVIQMGFIMTGCLLFFKINIPVAFAYPATFVPDLLVDLFQTWYFHPEPNCCGKLHYGLGGGGWGDALFLYPLFSVILVLYVQKWRKYIFERTGYLENTA